MSQNTSMDLSHVRSIFVIGQASTAPHLTGLKLVRVLDLEGCDGTTVSLDDLHKLQILRYLSLRGTTVSKLPETIGACLDSKVCLPNSLCRIPIPRHLKIPAHI
jgi:hypothetical protein